MVPNTLKLLVEKTAYSQILTSDLCVLNLTLVILEWILGVLQSSRPGAAGRTRQASGFGVLMTTSPNLLEIGCGLSGYTKAFEAFPDT